MQNPHFENIFFITIFIIATFLGWVIFQPYLSVFVIAGALALVFHPIYIRLVRFVRNQSVSALITVGIVICIVFVPLAFFGVRLVSETANVYASLASHQSLDFTLKVNTFVQKHFASLGLPDITFDINSVAQQGIIFFLNNFGPFFAGIGQFSFALFLSMLGLFYFLKDGAGFQKSISNMIPLAEEYKTKIVRDIGNMMKSVIEGTILMSVIQGILMGIIFLIFRIPNPAFWGGLISLASLIPVVGVWLVIIPVGGYLFVHGFIISSLLFLAISIVLTNLAYNLLAPKLMHRGNSVHPYIILMSILGGIAFFGPIGFLIGPMIVAFLFALAGIYPHYIIRG